MDGPMTEQAEQLVTDFCRLMANSGLSDQEMRPALLEIERLARDIVGVIQRSERKRTVYDFKPIEYTLQRTSAIRTLTNEQGPQMQRAKGPDA